MKREIKFRAWMNNQSMIYSKSYQSLTWFFDACESGILMQYTGLNDKNGTEIYEGDIITCDIYEREDLVHSVEDKPLKVYYEEWSAGFYPLNKGSQWRSGCEEIRVIGNIYEHPELLQ